MGIRVYHYQILSVKTHKVVNVFDQYKKNLVPWNIFFQIMIKIFAFYLKCSSIKSPYFRTSSILGAPFLHPPILTLVNLKYCTVQSTSILKMVYHFWSNAPCTWIIILNFNFLNHNLDVHVYLYISSLIFRNEDRTMLTLDEISQFNNGWTDEKNERFLSYIRQRWLVAPSHRPIKITLSKRVDFSQIGQSPFIDKVSFKHF